MKYIVQSTAVLDKVFIPGTDESINAMGGAGFYAMCGMKVWEDDVTIVTGTGADYIREFSKWYKDNGLNINGLISKDPNVPKTVVRYDEDGERTETPCLGPEHYKKIEATPKEIEPFLKNAEGVYVFKNTTEKYWKEMLRMKKELGFVLMWEIASDATIPENMDTVRSIASCADVFSINRTEALTMLGVNDVDEAVNILEGWKIPLIYLRLGSKGVVLIRGKEHVFVPSVPDITVVDSTGGGNSSTGGALIGYCRGLPLEEIGAMGNVSASFCIGQWGGPKCFDVELHMEAYRRKQKVLALCGGVRSEKQ